MGIRIEVVWGDEAVQDWDCGDADTIIVDFHEHTIHKRSGGIERPVWARETGALIPGPIDRRHNADRRE